MYPIVTYSRILVLAIIALLIPEQSWSQKIEASDSSSNVIVVGPGTQPSWSSSGLRLAYFRGGKLVVQRMLDSSLIELCSISTLAHLYWSDSATITVIRRIKEFRGYTATWCKVDNYSMDGSLISTRDFTLERTIRGIRSLSGNFRLFAKRNNGEVRFLSVDFSTASEIDAPENEMFTVSSMHFQFDGKWSVPKEDDIWIVNTSGEPVRNVTASLKAQSLISPQASPNGNLVLFSDGYGIRVYTIEGDSIGVVRPASAARWIPGTSSFVYLIVTDNGLDITSSDIATSDSSCSSITRITHTPGKMEWLASQSIRNQIVYRDSESGLIEVIDLTTPREKE